MKRYVPALIASILLVLTSERALARDDYEESGPWELSFMAGLNSDGWQSDVGVTYFPTPYFGVKAAIGMAGELEEIEYWGDDYYDTDRYASRFKFTPSVVLRTPALGKWHSGYASLHLFVNPGFILSPGARGSRNARVTCWDLKAGFTLNIGNGRISLGYNVSNFALYSGFPYSAYEQPDKDNYNTHSAFVALGFSF